jgi:hypothetical protein
MPNLQDLNRIGSSTAQMNATLASLVAHKAALWESLASKQAHLDTDDAVASAAPTRPSTPELDPAATNAIFDPAEAIASAQPPPDGSAVVADDAADPSASAVEEEAAAEAAQEPSA